MDTDTLYYIETLIESIQNDTSDLKDIVECESNKIQFVNNIISQLEELKSAIRD